MEAVFPYRAEVARQRPWVLPTLRPVTNDKDRKRRLAFAVFWAMWQRDVTPPKLAAAIGRDANTVRRWRDGETAPSVLDVGPLARALGVRPDYFTDPPEVPVYPFEDYLLETDVQRAVASGGEEGRRRSQVPRDPDRRPQSPARRAREGSARPG